MRAIRYSRSQLVSAAVIAGAVIAIVVCARLVANGSKAGIAMALLASIAVPTIAFSLRRPLVVPFALYAASIPFNDLGNIAGLGSLSKFFGLASVGAIGLWLITNRRAYKPPLAALFWLAVLLYSSLSSAWAVDPALPWPHVETLAQLLALYVLVSITPARERDLRLVIVFTVLGGVLAAAYGFHAFAAGGEVDVGGRLTLHDVDAGEVDPNQFATALIFPIALSLLAAVASERPWVRRAGLVAACLQFAVVLLTGSRGALIALCVLVAYILVRSPRRSRLLVPIALATLTALPFWNMLSKRLATALTSGGSGRTDIWEVGLHAFRHVWLLGAGIGNFSLVYDRAFLSVYQPNYEGWGRASHSLLIGTLVEGGVIGSLLTIAAFATQACILRSIPKDDALFSARIATEGALLAMLANALFLDVLYAKHLWLVLTVATLIRGAFHARTTVPGVRFRAGVRSGYGFGMPALSALEVTRGNIR